LEKAEREVVLQHLAHSRERLLEAVDGLTREQRSFHPGPDRWSVADCLEHLTVIERNLLRSIQSAAQGAPEPEKQPEALGKDQRILEAVPARSRRVQGPAEVMPQGRWTNFDECLRQFEAARERSLRFAAVTQADLRNHFFPHPFLGLLDCYQWLLFLGAHCERHVRQMEEVRADPGFPSAAQAAGA
jgi:uncharacterized damage-inducible protein DinB